MKGPTDHKGTGPGRTASGLPIIPALDGFRGYAILGVVVLHLLLFSGALAPTADSTVRLVSWGLFGNVLDAFFIISGFGLFLPVVARRGELGGLGRYAISRAARLFPAYWLCIAVVLMLLATVRPDFTGVGVPVTAFPGPAEVLVHLAALQMPARLFDGTLPLGFGIDGPLWMISVIVGFYVLFPLIARAYYRHPFAGLAIAAAITLSWKEAVLHDPGAFEALQGASVPEWVVQLIAVDQLPGWAFSFALGMTGAWTYHRLCERREPRSLARPAGLVAAGALLACAACAYGYGREATEVTGAISGSHARSSPLLSLAYSVSRATLLAAIALGPLWMQRPFANRPVRRLAELSYGVYLIHVVVALYVGVALLGLPSDGTPLAVAEWFGIVVPLSLAYAYASNRLVERPARDWARGVTRVSLLRPREALPTRQATSP